jgi:hypothetical protein
VNSVTELSCLTSTKLCTCLYIWVLQTTLSRCGCLSLSFRALLVDNAGRISLLRYLREIMQAQYQTCIAFASFNIARQFSDENSLWYEGESFICSFCFLLAHGTLLHVSTVLHQFICSIVLFSFYLHLVLPYRLVQFRSIHLFFIQSHAGLANCKNSFVLCVDEFCRVDALLMGR